MMREGSGRQIRSFQRAFHFELMLYTLGNVRPWRPVPARGVFYAFVCVVVMGVVAHLPGVGRLLSGLGPEALYGAIPLGAAWLLTVARIEGRRFDVAVRASARHAFRARTLVGAYRPMGRVGERWRPGRVLVVNDGRDGAPPDGVRLEGPGRVLLRYPCQARLDGPALTVAHTSWQACDPGQVLGIADGATVRFTSPPDQSEVD
jgi:hypothetical protein